MSVINIYMFGEVFEIFKNIFNGTIHYAMKFWSVLSIILIIWVFYHFLVDGEIMVRTGKLPETFVSHKEKIFNSNKLRDNTIFNSFFASIRTESFWVCDKPFGNVLKGV